MFCFLLKHSFPFVFYTYHNRLSITILLFYLCICLYIVQHERVLESTQDFEIWPIDFRELDNMLKVNFMGIYLYS